MTKVRLLWNTNFILLWIGYLVSSVGNHLNAIAFGVLVLEKTDSVFQMGVVLTTNFLPLMFGSLIAGPFVDRFSSKNIMIFADLIRGIILIGFVFYDRKLGSGMLEICIVAAINGFAQAWFAPASQTILRKVVAEENIVQANSYYQITGQCTEIVTKALSGFALALAGPVGLLLVDGVTFVISGVCEVFLKTRNDPTKAGSFSYFTDLKQGLNYLRSSPGVAITMLGVGVLNFFAIPGYVLMIPFFKFEPGLGMALYGVFMSMMAGGMIIGGILCSKSDKRFHYRLICLATISMNLLHIALSFSTAKWLILLCGLFIGICFAFGRILFNSVILGNTKSEFVGRIFSLLGFSAGILSPISMLLSGYLGEIFPIREVWRWSFTLSTVVTILVIARPSFYRAFNYNPEVMTKTAQ